MNPFLKTSFQERKVTGTQWFWFLALVGLATRLPLFKLATAETTDGVLCLTYFSDSFVQTPRFLILPGYPFLLRLGQAAGLAEIPWGRFLSALAGLLFLIPLWKFSRRWVSAETAGLTCLMALFSPLLWQWSLKVMTDTAFLMAFWWSLEELTKASAEKDERAWNRACLWGGAAALIRPEGLILMPWVLTEGRGLTPRRRWWDKRDFLLLSWALPFVFLYPRLGNLFLAFREGLGLAGGANFVQHPFLNFLEHFFAYLTQPIYIFTPLLFLAALAGLRRMLRREGAEGEAFRRIVFPVFLLLFLSRLIPTTYQDRHLLPFLPLFTVGAGVEMESFFSERAGKWGGLRTLLVKNSLYFLTFLFLIGLSASVLLLQHDSFGDIRRSGEFLRTLPADALIYSDEIPKTQYWSGRKVEPIPHPFQPPPGSFLILHSSSTDRLPFVVGHLRERFGAQLVEEDRCEVMPLLTDVMEDLSLQNRPRATSHRFEWQFFRSLVYRIP